MDQLCVCVDPAVADGLYLMNEQVEFYRYFSGPHMALVFRSTDKARERLAVKAHLIRREGKEKRWYMEIKKTKWKPPIRNFVSNLIHGPKLSYGKWTWASLSSYIIEFVASSNPKYNYLWNNCITFAVMLTGSWMYRRFQNNEGNGLPVNVEAAKKSTMKLGEKRAVNVYFDLGAIDPGQNAKKASAATRRR